MNSFPLLINSENNGNQCGELHQSPYQHSKPSLASNEKCLPYTLLQFASPVNMTQYQQHINKQLQHASSLNNMKQQNIGECSVNTTKIDLLVPMHPQPLAISPYNSKHNDTISAQYKSHGLPSSAANASEASDSSKLSEKNNSNNSSNESNDTASADETKQNVSNNGSPKQYPSYTSNSSSPTADSERLLDDDKDDGDDGDEFQDQDDKKNPWTIEEDRLLLSLYDKLGSKWSHMATFFKNRSRIQLKTRYKSICRARTKMWSAEEDRLLLEKCKDHGQSTNWGEIVSLFPKRTKNSLRVRYSELTNSKFRIHKTPNLGSPFQALVDESLLSKDATQGNKTSRNESEPDISSGAAKKRKLNAANEANSLSAKEQAVSRAIQEQSIFGSKHFGDSNPYGFSNQSMLPFAALGAAAAAAANPNPFQNLSALRNMYGVQIPQ